jgi:hypothetical protein
MFSWAGQNATTFKFGDLNNWNTSEVTTMSYMFSRTAGRVKNNSLNLSNWNTSKVTNMARNV